MGKAFALSRRRQQPNLPEETLRRARRAAGLLPEDGAESEAPAPAPEASESTAADAIAGDAILGDASATAVAPEEAVSRAAQRAARRRQRLERVSQTDAHSEALDAATMAERLRQPTRVVSESELRADYAYVLRDLRSMAILAAVLVAALFLLAFAWGM